MIEYLIVVFLLIMGLLAGLSAGYWLRRKKKDKPSDRTKKKG